MVNAASIQNKIETKIFQGLGSTAQLAAYNEEEIDKWGDSTIEYKERSDIIVVPYNYINKRTDFQPFGDVQKGSVIMAVKHDLKLNVKDKITYDSKTLFVRQIEKFNLQDLVLVKVIELVEQLS